MMNSMWQEKWMEREKEEGLGLDGRIVSEMIMREKGLQDEMAHDSKFLEKAH